MTMDRVWLSVAGGAMRADRVTDVRGQAYTTNYWQSIDDPTITPDHVRRARLVIPLGEDRLAVVGEADYAAVPGLIRTLPAALVRAAASVPDLGVCWVRLVTSPSARWETEIDRLDA